VDYRVTAVDTSGLSASLISPAVIVDINPFAAPTPGGVFGSAGPGPGQASVAWDVVPDDPNDSTDQITYRVYRQGSAGAWTLLVQPAIDYWDPSSGSQGAWVPVPANGTIPALKNRIRVNANASTFPERSTATLAVTAVGPGGESPRSAPVVVRPALSQPGSPDFTTPTRTWRTTATMGLNPVQGFAARFYRRLERQPGVYELRNGTPTTTTYTDQGLDPCRRYYYLATQAEMAPVDGSSLPTGEESGDSLSFSVERYILTKAPALPPTTVGLVMFRWGVEDLDECVVFNVN
jgi:hypothetical protein